MQNSANEKSDANDITHDKSEKCMTLINAHTHTNHQLNQNNNLIY